MTDYFAPEIAAPRLPIGKGSADTAAVRRLQEWLVVRGYTIVRDRANAPGIDGDFGDGTAAGIATFAHDNGLQPVVDDRFWLRLTSSMLAAASFRPTATDLGAAVVQVAEAFLLQGAREARQLIDGRLAGYDNSGPWVRAVCFGAAGAPWCMGFAREPLKRAAAALGVPLPIALEGAGILPLYVPSIVNEAAKAHRFVRGETAGFSTVRPGSLFFLRGLVDGVPSHSHVGIVVDWAGPDIVTIEGNTNSDGSANGWLVLKRQRRATTCDFGVV